MRTVLAPSQTDVARVSCSARPARRASAGDDRCLGVGGDGRLIEAPQKLARRQFLAVLATSVGAQAAPWRQFLGNGSRSLDGGERLPTEWSDGHNVAWRAAVPGYGQSSPVVVQDRAFVTSVDGAQKESLLVTSIDLALGELLWTQRIDSAQRIEESDMVSTAAPTPAVHGDTLITFFETGNLLATSLEGERRWERRLTEEYGEFRGRHGVGSSLRMCRAGVLALVAHDGPSYLICVDPEDGRTVWKTDRSDGVSWSTPTTVEHGGREFVLVSAGGALEAYATEDGSQLWVLDGLDGAFIASPTPMNGGAIIGSSMKGKTAAVRFGSEASSVPEVVWHAQEASSYFSSPLLHRDRVYMTSKAGIAFCLRSDTGDSVWHSRLEGQCWASSIGLGDHVYFFGVDGVTDVVQAGDKFVPVASNRLSVGGRLYGVALADRGLLLRYAKDLVLVAGGGPPDISP